MKYLLFIPLIICGFSFTNISKVNPANGEDFCNIGEYTHPPFDDTSDCPDFQAFLEGSVTNSDIYAEAKYDIIAANIIESDVTVVYDAGRAVKLNPGFHAKRGSNFHAFIDGCGGITSPILDRSDVSASEEASELDNIQSLPTEFTLYNYPNPFTGQTTIEYNLPNDSPVTLTVTDLAGKRIAVLANHEQQERGIHTITFNADNYPTGIYYYTIQAGNFAETRKMTLAK